MITKGIRDSASSPSLSGGGRSDGAGMDEEDQFESDVLDLRDLDLDELARLRSSAFVLWLRRVIQDDADSEADYTRFTSQI
jgi:hypothetical protein